MNKLAPSILASDFSNLKNEIHIIENAGADYLHIDVMDGHFVPNITIGPPVIQCIRQNSSLIFDVHLMISKPQIYLSEFYNAGADILNIHVEAVEDLDSVISQIRRIGAKAAVTLKPETKIDVVVKYLEFLDMILIMSVDPGFGGQTLIFDTLKKIEFLANFKQKNNLNYDIEIDGGVSLDNLRTVLDAGTNVIVSGSAIFHRGDPKKTSDAVCDFKKIMGI